ncbi:MAG TPA: toxin glutamine deamidase domain-containing protein, partial [Aeromicrobium sp.]|nr:toxin glutamine deamidase domain-containing protein [Aeromicrobium sp.]
MGVVASGGAGTGGARIEVEPQVLIRAGQRMGSIGTQLGMLSDALGAALGSGIASGMDPAGANFGLEYGSRAQEFAKGLADAVNSFKAVGYMLEATGYNYKNADAASTVGGSGPTGGVGDAPAEKTAANMPAGPNLAMVPPPFKWSLIQPFLRAIPVIGMFTSAAMTWPSGNPSLMRLTAAQWRNLAQGLSAFDEDIPALKTAVSVQEIPEGARIGDALTELDDGLSGLADSASETAQLIDDFANGVQDTQDAIRRLLDRISLDGLWDTVTGFLTGEADDILREVARDVGDVLENFQSQVKGIVGLLEALATAIGDAATKFQEWIRPILVEHLGEDVGGALADAVTLYTDFQVGAVTGLIGTVSGTVAMADPDTWKGMAEVAMSVAEDPSTLPSVLANMGKEFVAWDKWSGEHPGRAAGEAAFNIGSLFVPGGPLTKSGTLAKGLTYGSRLLEEGRLPRLTDLPGVGPRTPNLDGLDDLPGIGPRAPDVPEFRPGPIPESVLGPVAPNGIDAPSSPHGLGGPAGPPDPPGSTGTPGGSNHYGGGDGGGDGPPPDSPGRPVGPPESGPGRVDGPATQPPASGPVDSQRVSEPSAPTHTPSYGDQTPPATQNVPESSSPTGTHDAGSSTSDPGPSTGEHATPEAPRNGHATEQQGGNDAPSEIHRPGSEEYSGRPDEPAHTPAPAPEQHSANERPATDGGQTREQPQTSGDGEGRRNEPVGTTPGVMGGVGAPMGSHGSGTTHNAADSQAPASKTQTPDTTTRNPDTKTSHAGSPESSRAQSPVATGPESARTPTVPVNPAAAQPVPDAAGEPIRPGPEPQIPPRGENARDGSPAPHPETDGTPDAARDDRPGNQSDPSAPQQDPGTGNAHSEPPDPSGPVGNPSESRVYGPHELDFVEDPAYQTAVENALRNADGEYLIHADPRANPYGTLINDGGHEVDGRNNNCLDCSLSALASFNGNPTVSAPRYLDELPDGTIDTGSGENSGLRRASDWLGGPVTPVSPSLPIADRFAELHRQVAEMGPGSSALVVNEWNARNPLTDEPLHHADGRPVIDGSHATVVVYPENAAGPVWWDPQMRTTSDHPPASMVERSASLWATTLPPSEGGHGHATGNTGSGTGVSGADPTERDVQRVSVREWMDLQGGHPSGGEPAPRPGDGEPD